MHIEKYNGHPNGGDGEYPDERVKELKRVACWSALAAQRLSDSTHTLKLRVLDIGDPWTPSFPMLGWQHAAGASVSQVQ